jgi:LacI family transcriptional regulator
LAGQELAVIGFGDVQDARHAKPAFTTVAVDPPGLGKRVAQILVRQISNPIIKPVEYHAEARLMVRASCGSASDERRRMKKS